MDYEKMRDGILKAVGGRENVRRVYHCVTRLRFELYNEELFDENSALKVEDVAGVFYRLGEYQFVIGIEVSQLYQVVKNGIYIE